MTHATTLPQANTEPMLDAAGDRDPELVQPLFTGTERYRIEGRLGRGGMGEVLLAHDRYLERPVALKRAARAADPETNLQAGAHLLREAQLQARLDHPAFVPVFDCGAAADGSAYFTMARVDGVTMADQIALARTRSRHERARSRLLRSFAQLCHAIDRAHAAGIVHGDLKPSNLMLGTHGQAYVLDLGMASQMVPPLPTSEAPASRVLSGGTPGYSAPEQFGEGEPSARWDVYALGAILFEILTFERLHEEPPRDVDEVAERYSKTETSPRKRYPELDVAPELDVLCTAALRVEPNERIADVRTITNALDDYLDGQRDHEARRAIADRYVEQALDCHDRALDRANAESSTELWRRAVSLLAQALALVPAHPAATRTMAVIAGRTPPELDAQVEDRLELWTQAHLRSALRAAGLAYAAWFLCPVVMWLMGIRDASALAWLTVFGGVSVAWCLWASRRPVIGTVHLVMSAVFSGAALFVGARWFSPYVVASGAFVANAVAFGMMPTRRSRAISLVVTLVAMLGTVLVDHYRTNPMLVIQGDTLVIHADLTRFPPEITWWALAFLPIGTALMGFGVVATTARSLVETTRREYREHWLLAALAPASETPIGSDAIRLSMDPSARG